MKLSLPNIASPFIWLPLDEGVGLSVNNVGTDEAFTLIDGGSNIWDNAGWFTGSASHNYAYTDEPIAADICNVFKGAVNGAGGKTVFIACDLVTVAATSVILTMGSTAASSAGFQIYINSSGSVYMLPNPDGASTGTAKKLSNTSAMPTIGEHNLALMLDFKNGDYRCWIDGEKSITPNADRVSLLSQVNDMTLQNGLTLMSRNASTVPNGHAPQTSNTGQMRNFFAADLTALDNAWTYADKVVKDLFRLKKLPSVLENW